MDQCDERATVVGFLRYRAHSARVRKTVCAAPVKPWLPFLRSS